MTDHLIRLENIGYYAAPKTSEVIPARIPEGCERVEILSGGKIRFELDGEERIFTRGTVFWHQFGDCTICKTFADDPYRCLVLNFKVRDTNRPGPRVSIWETPDEAVAFAEECQKAFHSGMADLEALSHYAYSMIRWKAHAAQLHHPPESPKCLLSACAFIEQHLSEPISPEDIASFAGISRPYLFAMFRKYYHKAPLHYIQERRIAQAKVMLTADDGSSIKEIAMRSGFKDLEVFYRQFRKQTGITPAGYRRKYSVRPISLQKLPQIFLDSDF